MTAPDMLPLVSTVGGGFLAGALAGYVLKKVIKIVAVVVGLFIAALAYLDYQRIISVDWEVLQSVSQNAITTSTSTLTLLPNYIGADHTTNLTISNLGIPLASSASAGFALGMVRG
jgi:uncharacterized membrane protein (Fun14 family)